MDNGRRPTCIAMGQLSDSASGKTKVKGFNICVLKQSFVLSLVMFKIQLDVIGFYGMCVT